MHVTLLCNIGIKMIQCCKKRVGTPTTKKYGNVSPESKYS